MSASGGGLLCFRSCFRLSKFRITSSHLCLGQRPLQSHLTAFPTYIDFSTIPLQRTSWKPHSFPWRPFCANPEVNKEQESQDKKSSLVQRFKEAYAIYGKVVIVTHGLTSCLWLGLAYGVSLCGVNILDLFEAAHFPEWMCRPLRMGGGSVGQWATALVLYKLIAPLRYAVTLVLTRYVVKYLRATGKAPPLTDRNRLRTLARESAQISRDRLKVRLSKGRKKAVSVSKTPKVPRRQSVDGDSSKPL